MRRFEFVGGSSAKFWMCKVEDSTFTIVFGRLGTDGQRKEKEFDDEDEANEEMERKITEKLKEGYVEVSADGAAAAPAGAKGADAASAKLTMPARVTSTKASDPALHKAACTALKAFARSASSRSWRRAMAAKEARRALKRLGAAEVVGELAEAVDGVVDGANAKPALPLRLVLGILGELPASAFARAVSRLKDSGPNGGAVKTLKAVHAALGDDELALRVGGALVDRGSSDAGAAKRFANVKSFAEAAAAKSGGLKKFLSSLDDGGDAVVARRKNLFAA